MKSRKSKVRIQKRILGFSRQRMSTSVEREIEDAIQNEMKIWNVSRSFVLATCAAFALDVHIEDNYKTIKLVKRRA